jgi:hypothetical protein
MNFRKEIIELSRKLDGLVSLDHDGAINPETFRTKKEEILERMAEYAVADAQQASVDRAVTQSYGDVVRENERLKEANGYMLEALEGYMKAIYETNSNLHVPQDDVLVMQAKCQTAMWIGQGKEVDPKSKWRNK